jgi:hypothetical protein
MATGNAPCDGCGRHIWDIPLDKSTKVSDGNGGFWYRVVTVVNCQECGIPLVWLHEPASQSLQIEMPAQQGVHLTKSQWAKFWDKLSAAFRR